MEWHDEGFCSVGAISFDNWSNQHQDHHITDKSDIVWGKSNWFRWMFPTQDECLVHHFEPEAKRQYMQGKHPPLLAPKKTKVISSAGNLAVSGFEMQRALYLLTLFKGAKPSMESTRSTWWGSYECLSRLNTQENGQKVYCFIRTVL